MEEITKIMSGQKYVTLSSVIILTNGPESLYNLMKRENSPTLVQNVVDEFLRGISTRLSGLEQSKTLLVSTFLDPRFKNVSFSSENIAD